MIGRVLSEDLAEPEAPQQRTYDDIRQSAQERLDRRSQRIASFEQAEASSDLVTDQQREAERQAVHAMHPEVPPTPMEAVRQTVLATAEQAPSGESLPFFRAASVTPPQA